MNIASASVWLWRLASCRLLPCRLGFMTVTPVNTGIPRLVGLLSHKSLFSFSFEETARVESLCKGLSSEQSSGFFGCSLRFSTG